MLSKRLVEGGTMSLAQGEVRGGGTQAFPKELHQAEFLRGRKLEDFGEVGVAHGEKANTAGGMGQPQSRDSKTKRGKPDGFPR